MKGFLIFLAIVLGINGLGAYYIWVRTIQAFSLEAPASTWFTIALIFFAHAYILSKFIERRNVFARVSAALDWIGSFWFFALCYAFLALVLIDLVRLIDWIFPFVHPADPLAFRKSLGFTVLAIIEVAGIIGHLNARVIRVRPLHISIDKPHQSQSLTIIATADFHLGTLMGKWKAREIVRKINRENPDIVLIAGDIVDGAVEPVERLGLGVYLTRIESKYGVFACTGNHEYIGNIARAAAYIQEHGVRLLRDEVVHVAGLTIIGREDRSSVREGNERKTLGALLSDVDHSAPLILLDHQPFHLEEAEKHEIDFQLSGHTHHGQFFPINLITKAIYEVSWGYKRKGRTHVYVTCGAGTWGPQVRIGSTPEIMKVTVTFAASA